jgi:hypothetical protein
MSTTVDAAANKMVHEVTKEGITPQELMDVYKIWAKDYDEVKGHIATQLVFAFPKNPRRFSHALNDTIDSIADIVWKTGADPGGEGGRASGLQPLICKKIFEIYREI